MLNVRCVSRVIPCIVLVLVLQHPLKIYRQPCRLNVSLYSFANRIIDIWNNLPFEIVCVSSIAAFKRKPNTLDLTPFILAEY